VTIRYAPPHRQRGVAVITALLLATLAVTIVASLFWQQQVQVRSIENQRLQLQKQWVLRGALDWASLILREDAKHSSLDTLEEPWAVPLAETRLDQYLENGRGDAEYSDATLTGSIRDAQARFNLTNLSVDGIINPLAVTRFERLLNRLNLDTGLAQATANLMATTQKGRSSPPRKTAVRPVNLIRVEDLLAVPDFTPAALERLEPYVIFIPETTPVNVNTASAEVLSAQFDLSPGDTAMLIDSRDTAAFKDIADFSTRLGGKILSAPPDLTAVTTHYFLVNGKIRIGRAALSMQALINRDAGNTEVKEIREY
jgi:general secretion pathway protein K